MGRALSRSPSARNALVVRDIQKLDLGAQHLQVVGLFEVPQRADDGVALVGQEMGESQAEAAAGAGDEDGLWHGGLLPEGRAATRRPFRDARHAGRLHVLVDQDAGTRLPPVIRFR